MPRAPKPSTDLTTRMQGRAVAPAKAGGTDIFSLLEKQRDQISRALPKHMSADRLLRVVVTQIRTNPKLGECTPQSLLGALMLSAQLGLEPGPLGQVYYVPFFNSKLGSMEVTFMIGYKGLIQLALRSEKIESIEGHEIREGDMFSFDYGTGHVSHTYQLTKDRGAVVGYWAKATLANGGHVMRVLTQQEVDARRARSKSKDSGPWVTDPVAMGIKTAIRVLCSQLPLSIEAERAVAADETATVAEATGETIDINPSLVSEETGEIVEVQASPEPQCEPPAESLAEFAEAHGFATPMMADTDG